MSTVTDSKEFRLKWEGRELNEPQDLWKAIADLLYIIENLEIKLANKGIGL